ncbi:hypothetical protein BRN45_11955, partial [Xanthomonas oryzae pv. oryzae]
MAWLPRPLVHLPRDARTARGCLCMNGSAARLHHATQNLHEAAAPWLRLFLCLVVHACDRPVCRLTPARF